MIALCETTDLLQHKADHRWGPRIPSAVWEMMRCSKSTIVRRAKQTRSVHSFHSLPGGTSALAACTRSSLSRYLQEATDADAWQLEIRFCMWRQEDLQGTLVKIKTHANISPHSNTAAVLRAALTSWASLRRDQVLLKLTILLKIYAKFRHLLSGAIIIYLLALMQDVYPTCISIFA